ncbi:hypothetical protein QQF64_031352 [Cirrhinus molitorella]|uniref:Uncharacterized protein n=1 Tax=Cirrhinus molitorella TaxID=172907 RepID=A0ABR3MWP8_9TELE
MQQRCDDKKKEDEAFKLCLPRKTAPRQAPPARPPIPPVSGRPFHQGKIGLATNPLLGRASHPPRNPGEDHPPPRLPRRRENPPTLTRLTPSRNESGRPDARDMRDMSLRLWATSPSDSISFPEIPFKKRKICHAGFEQAKCSVAMGSPPSFKGFERENISLDSRTPSLVCPLDGANVPRMSELDRLAALSSSPARVGSLRNHVTAWLSVSAPEWVVRTITKGPPVSSERGDLPPPPRQGGSLGLARERANLNTLGLPPRVVITIQNARASSTHSLYDCKWHVFEEWCKKRQLISYQCSVVDILSFLQDLIDGGRSFSTIKVYLAAIAACHIGCALP